MLSYVDVHDPTLKGIDKVKKENMIVYDKVIRFETTKILEQKYIPLSFALRKENVSREEIYGIISILKPLLSKICKTKVIDIEFEESAGYILNPITEFDIAVYINPMYVESIYSQVNLVSLIGYTLLTDNKLSRYIVEKENIENVKYVEGISIIPISNTKIESTQYEKVQNFYFILQSFIQKGVFSYAFSPWDSEDYDFVKQLCNMFEIHILEDKDFSCWVLQTDIDFAISPDLWIKSTLPLIKGGDFPLFTFRRISYDNDYDRRYGTTYVKHIMKYCALMAYAQLSDKYPTLKKFIYGVQVNEDLSVTAPLPSAKIAREYFNTFEALYSPSTKYTVETADTLEEAIVKRYVIQSVDDDAYSIILGTEPSYVIVHRSPLANNYPSPFVFDTENMEKKKEELLEKSREYYKKCHDNIEPVTLDKISQMDVSEILSLIPIIENNVTYCYTKETLLQVERNPLTRKPFSLEVVDRINNLEYGLRGFFDVGILYGLLTDTHLEEKVPGINLEDIGLTRLVRISVEEKYRELYGNIFLVQVVFRDNTTSDLFEICLPTIELGKIDELRAYVTELWKKGFFLSPWSINLLRNQYSSFFIKITDPILVHAKDSIFDGNIALEYLKNQI